MFSTFSVTVMLCKNVHAVLAKPVGHQKSKIFIYLTIINQADQLRANYKDKNNLARGRQPLQGKSFNPTDKTSKVLNSSSVTHTCIHIYTHTHIHDTTKTINRWVRSRQQTHCVQTGDWHQHQAMEHNTKTHRCRFESDQNRGGGLGEKSI